MKPRLTRAEEDRSVSGLRWRRRRCGMGWHGLPVRRMTFEEFRALRSTRFSQMLQKLDGASQCRWIMTRNILRKQPRELFTQKKCSQRNGKFFNGQVGHLISTQASVLLNSPKTKLTAERPTQQAAPEGGCSEGIAPQGRRLGVW